MTSLVITDEMVLIGVNAELAEEGSPPMDANHPWTGHHSMVRAALLAVAPMILEEAAKVARARINQAAFTREQKAASDVAAEIEAAIRVLKEPRP
jgi:hypothetical protein